MAQSEKRDFLLVLLICIFIQVPDFLVSIPKDPFWYEYLFNAAVDSIAFCLILFVITRSYPMWGICLAALQSTSFLTHFLALCAHIMYNETGIQSFAQLCNLYTPTLQGILVLKTLVIGAGGYGIYRRTRNVSDDSAAYPCGVHIPSTSSLYNVHEVVEKQK